MGYVVAIGGFLAGMFLMITGSRERQDGPTEQERQRGTEKQTIGVALLLVAPLLGVLIQDF
ncbi:hypothetical protein [Leisingera sp. ANG59]|uniref:hypothetical protein n=1 Tax=Leisingera sp. ANG59 TaxID=2675221 RepID=UPI0015724B9B|nr:hypothetical protein [Leisingera sp. ANG59]NSY36857.1 hypothetical protein [Leisingera sp. ANG59]